MFLKNIFIYLFMVMKVLVTQSSLTLFNPMDCSPWGFSIHGTLQARILEWVAKPFSRGTSWPRDLTQVSCIVSRFFTIWASWPRKSSAYLFIINEYVYYKYLFLTVLNLHCCICAFSSCSAQASHCSGFSCCRAQALGYAGFRSCSLQAGSVVVVLGLSCSIQA